MSEFFNELRKCCNRKPMLYMDVDFEVGSYHPDHCRVLVQCPECMVFARGDSFKDGIRNWNDKKRMYALQEVNYESDL